MNDCGYTALHYAVWAEASEAIRALVSYDANLTAKNTLFSATRDWVQVGHAYMQNENTAMHICIAVLLLSGSRTTHFPPPSNTHPLLLVEKPRRAEHVDPMGPKSTENRPKIDQNTLKKSFVFLRNSRKSSRIFLKTRPKSSIPRILVNKKTLMYWVRNVAYVCLLRPA